MALVGLPPDPPSAGELLEELHARAARGEISQQQLLSRVEADVSPAYLEALRAQLKPAGFFDLPPLLEGRRTQFGIPNQVFHKAAVGNSVFLWQIAEQDEGQQIGTTDFVKPETTMRNERERSCRGILVSAGLTALDVLKSHDVHLGDIVMVLQHSPWRMKVGEVAGISRYVLVCQAGNVIGCEGTAYRLHKRILDCRDESELLGESRSPEHRYFAVETGKLSPKPLAVAGGEDNWIW